MTLGQTHIFTIRQLHHQVDLALLVKFRVSLSFVVSRRRPKECISAICQRTTWLSVFLFAR